jgi:hypothetical protein
MKIIIYSVLLFFTYGHYASAAANPIKDFLFIDSSEMSFDNDVKQIPGIFFTKVSNGLVSKKMTYAGLLIQWMILKAKDTGYVTYNLVLIGEKGCQEIVDRVREAYDKEFVHYVDGNILEGSLDSATGSIDFVNYRVRFWCESREEESGGVKSTLLLYSGKKADVTKVLARQQIQCSYNHEVNKPFAYQIDYDRRVLRNTEGYVIGRVSKFDDNIIVVRKEIEGESFKIILDRKSGSLEVIVGNSNTKLYGSCKKRSSVNKF